jgi:hypothetical protein
VRADELADLAEREALAYLAAAHQLVARADGLRQQGGWAAELHEQGVVRPWMHTTRSSGAAAVAIAAALARLEEERRRRAEFVTELERRRLQPTRPSVPSGVSGVPTTAQLRGAV